MTTAPANTNTTETESLNLCAVMGTKIPEARCESYLRKRLNPDAADIKTLTDESKVEGTTDARKAEIAAEIAALVAKNEKVIRVSDNTPVALSIIWDSAIKELIQHACDQATESKMKTINCHFTGSGNHSKLTYAPLYETLLNWKKVSDFDESKYKVVDNNDVEVEGVSIEPISHFEDEEYDDGEDDIDLDATKMEKGTHSFCTYVGKMFDVVKNEPGRPRSDVVDKKSGKTINKASMHKSENFTIYASDLIIAGIERQAECAKVLITDVVDSKTVKVDHIIAVLKTQLINGGRSQNQIDAAVKDLRDKLALCEAHKEVKAKGAAAAKLAKETPEQKAAREEKEAEAAALKLKNEQAAKTKKMKELGDEVKVLNAKVAKVSPKKK